MRRLLLLLLALPALVAPGVARDRAGAPAAGSLVDAEHAFCLTSVKEGTRGAFLAYLAPDAVLFRPRPVAGRAWYLERPEMPGVLTWEPAFAEVSGAGDLGYTTGPWEFRQDSAAARPVAFGHYVSIWRMQRDGAWRVVVDVGNTHARPEGGAVAPGLVPGEGGARTAGRRTADMGAARVALLEADRSFSRASAERGATSAFQSFSAEDIRLYRPNAFPFIGRHALGAAVSDTAGRFTWAPLAAEIARSGDLGYTYGLAELLRATASATQADSMSYLRIWRRRPDGTWQVALDIVVPLRRE